MGKVDKVNPRDNTFSIPIIPIVGYSNNPTNISELTYFTVKNLRNDVHLSKERPLIETMVLFRQVVAAYLFTIKENLSLINSHINPLFKYLKNIQDEFKNVANKVIELDSEERYIMRDRLPEIEALEWKDNEEDIYEPKSLDDEIQNDDRSRKNYEKISVFDLPSIYDKFWIIGEPGAGKSFSLKAIALLFARKIMDLGAINCVYPIYIVANQFSSNRTFKKLVIKNLRINEEAFDSFVAINPVLILLDGFNEISKPEKANAIRDLEALFDEVPQLKIIISARKYGFKELFGYPVFELLPLTEKMIEEYVRRYVPVKEKADEVVLIIQNSNSLILDFARNPLMLQMLIKVIIQFGKSPENRGKLFYYFTNWFFQRENKIQVIDFVLTEKVLATVAFKMRSEGQISISKNDLLQYIKDELDKWNYTGDLITVYHQLVDSFLEIDSTAKIIFFHELVLEYFAAVKLNNYRLENGELEKSYFTKVEWSEPLIMLSGIMDDATSLITSIYKSNIILAARCISAGAVVSQEVTKKVILTATAVLEKKNKGKSAAITCLLELGTPDALRVIIKLPTKLEESLVQGIVNCQRPEMAVLKLLKFGLTGKNRVRQCLSVFYKKPISSSILNSDEVSNAQKILFEAEQLIEYRDLELIEDIGISNKAKSTIKRVINYIISNVSIKSSIWRKAIQIAGNNNFISENIELIIERLDNDNSIDGPMCYSLFVACTELPDSLVKSQLVLKAARFCIDKKYYGLTIFFIKRFNLNSEFKAEEIEAIYASMANDGKIKPIIEFGQLFPSFPLFNYLDLAINSLVKKVNFHPIFENVNLLNDLGYDLKDTKIEKDILISFFNKFNLRMGKIVSILTTLNFNDKFSNFGIVTVINNERNFAFLRNIFSQERYFFRPAENGQVKVKMLVEYKILSISEDPNRKTVVKLIG